ncbi:MAG: hypothetical protein ACHQIO_01215 [Nevskiales bacterium]
MPSASTRPKNTGEVAAPPQKLSALGSPAPELEEELEPEEELPLEEELATEAVNEPQ